MKEKIAAKSWGFYFTSVAGIIGIISIIRFVMWALPNDSMDMIIVVGLAAGIILDFVLIYRGNDYVVIAAVVCYSIAVVKFLTNSVGSFVDAFQGINMFGDASQVGNIISIAAVLMAGVLFSIIGGFLKNSKVDE